MSEKHHKGKTEEEIDDQTEDYKNIQYRMYEKKFPDVDDLVMCKIIEIFNDGAYVILEEYNNIKGLLLCTEISRKRVNYVTRLIKEGKEEVLRVKTIDKEKGFIDLSKKSVKAEEVEQFKEKYAKSKAVHVIMKILSKKCNIPIDKLYKEITWPLYKKYEHAYDAFKLALNKFEEVFKDIKMTEPVKKELMEILRQRMKPKPVNIKSDFIVRCDEFEGIDAIKFALMEGEKKSTKNIPIKFKIISSPLYECSIETINKKEGLDVMKEALKEVERVILEKKGKFFIQSNPTVSGESEKSENMKNEIKGVKEDAEKIWKEEEEENEEEENHDEGIHADIDKVDDFQN
jgi:translation initiation factor 2 subunit 1